MTIFTIGYEGLDTEMFISLLTHYQVETVVDIRELPISRKPGFSKKGLANLLHLSGFEYIHMASLGCPRVIRDQYRKDNNWKNYTVGFLKHLEVQNNSVVELAATSNSALLCYEADYNFCHQVMVANAVKDFSGVEIQHIRANKADFKTVKAVQTELDYAYLTDNALG